jgi:hypothetical protein
MTHFDEVSRRIRWFKNEFSHSFSPEPTAVGACGSAVAVHVNESAVVQLSTLGGIA